MATLWSTVVRPCALRTIYGISDDELTSLGRLPSLHESIKTWSKSRFRVSSTPIICRFTAGSPWNGIVVVCIIWSMIRVSVLMSTARYSSPVASSCIRVITACIRNIDSCMNCSSYVASPVVGSMPSPTSRCTRRSSHSRPMT